MATLEKVYILEWMHQQKKLMSAHTNDMDIEIRYLRSMVWTGNITEEQETEGIYGVIREKGCDLDIKPRVFAAWNDVLFYYRLTDIRMDKYDGIFGNIDIYSKDNYHIQQLLKKYKEK